MTQPPAAPVDLEKTMEVVRRQHAVADAMHFAEAACGYCDAGCREALVLAASELTENIVKYGAQQTEPAAGTLSVQIQGDVVRICAKNAVASPDDARMVVDTISRIGAPSADATQLYRARLRELYSNPHAPRAQLGLLRLAFEAGFRLSASYQSPWLQVIAERPCRSQ